MKALKWILISLLVILAIAYGGFRYLKHQTKQLSPEGTVSFVSEPYDVKIFYNRPSVRGRTIFGNVVPYNEVWRTGANEPTTFTTATDLTIDGQTLPAGTYSLWTIPGPEEWQIIWNSGEYPWGHNWENKAAYDAQYDVVKTSVYKETIPNIIETLTISLVETPDGFEFQMLWENVMVRVPIQ